MLYVHLDSILYFRRFFQRVINRFPFIKVPNDKSNN
ncbi:hypothetical protein L425_00979 [Klebsiella quasipneumoniae subsp. quasipneumoniae]|nr:hypothetical protein L425_00979 [Klebsiella quasipneumoniae subsp. quasipneumoniae]